jgi:N6-adenosine-specific RNA methylase IME4
LLSSVFLFYKAYFTKGGKNMNDLTVIQNNLPNSIEDLSKFVLIGRDKLQAVKAEISAIQKLGLAKEVYEQKKSEAQEIAETVTLAEMRTGELLKQIPKVANNQYTKLLPDTDVAKQKHEEKQILQEETQQAKHEPIKTKTEIIKDLGFSPKQAERMQTLAENPEIVKQAIQEARNNDDIVSRAFVLGKIKQEKRKENIQKQVENIEKGVEAPTGKFDVIAIDPPWNYGTQFNASGRRVANPYPEMTQEELKKIELPASENCVLFLWTTHKFIWDAKELLDEWGFEYRSMFVWDKQKIGMGNLVRMQCEFCLMGIKGNPVFRDAHNIRDIFSEPRREHSRKPEAFYEMVNNLCVGRKLDYFSREHRDGWCSYGNDTEKF